MKLTLPYPPSANRYWRVFRGMVVPSVEAKAYKTAVRWRAIHNHLVPLDGDVCIHVELYRPRARGDLDNFLKVLFDALNGLAWADDGQVVEIHARRHEDKLNPRVEIEVTQ